MKTFETGFVIKQCELKIAKTKIEQTKCDNYVAKLQLK